MIGRSLIHTAASAGGGVARFEFGVLFGKVNFSKKEEDEAKNRGRVLLRFEAGVGAVGFLITTAPDMRLADHFESANERNEPPKPMIREKISKLPRSNPLAVR